MATLQVPPPLGRPIMYVHKAMIHAQERHNAMKGCRSCDQAVAQSWKEAAEFFQDLKTQLESQANG